MIILIVYFEYMIGNRKLTRYRSPAITPAIHSWFCIDLASQLGILMMRLHILLVVSMFSFTVQE